VKARTAAVLAATALLLGACAGGEAVTGDRRNVGVVSVVFSARPARGRVGQAVALRISLVNNSGQTQAVAFPDAQQYDFWAKRGSREVWRWSDGRLFAAATTTLELASQEPRMFSETWTPEQAGEYDVFGTVTSKGYDRPLAGEVVVE
jgi:hypothetical protein